jgi:transcriptional regulator with XRE-family HTH domain
MGDLVESGRVEPNGAKIAELRKQNGMTQEDLAKKAGYSERLLRDIERKNHAVPVTTITEIATVLNVAPGEITRTPAGDTI